MRLILCSLALSAPAWAQGAAARGAARELISIAESRFVREAGAEGAAALESRLALAIERHGDDLVAAVRRVGPRAGLDAVEAHGPAAARLLAEFGDEGLRLISVDGASAVRIAQRHGKAGVEQLIRHRGIAAPLIERFGDDAVRALRRVSPDGAITLRRLEREILESGRRPELLAVVERFGDRACDFLWRNKGTVFGTAFLAAFLSDPGPYIDGVKKLALDPLRETAVVAAQGTNWTLVVLALLAAGGAWIRIRRGVAKTPRGA